MWQVVGNENRRAAALARASALLPPTEFRVVAKLLTPASPDHPTRPHRPGLPVQPTRAHRARFMGRPPRGLTDLLRYLGLSQPLKGHLAGFLLSLSLWPPCLQLRQRRGAGAWSFPH